MKKSVFLILVGFILFEFMPSVASMYQLDTIVKDSSYSLSPTYVEKWDSIVWMKDNGDILYTTSNNISGDKSPNYAYDAINVTNETIIAVTYRNIIHYGHNLLVNGSFENGYSGFDSDCQFPKDDNGNLIDNPQNAYQSIFNREDGNHCAISSDANRFSPYFEKINPVAGNRFLLIDGITNNQIIAWKATTKTNPNLKIVADSIYLFSFKYASPDNLESLDITNTPALVVEFVLNNGIYLFTSKTTGSITNNWNQFNSTINFLKTCDNVEIRISNQTENSKYNDFCIDDIEFRSAKNTIEIVQRDTFILNGACSNKVYKKWNDVLVVNNENDEYIAYQWYKNGKPIEGANKQFYQIDTTTTGYEKDIYYAQMITVNNDTICSCKHFSIDRLPLAKNKELTRRQEIKRRIFYQGTNLSIIEIFYDDGSRIVRKVTTK